MTDEEFTKSKVRLDMIVEVTHETTDTDGVIEETAIAKYGAGVVLSSDITERDIHPEE